jgi:hypothetical protein
MNSNVKRYQGKINLFCIVGLCNVKNTVIILCQENRVIKLSRTYLCCPSIHSLKILFTTTPLKQNYDNNLYTQCNYAKVLKAKGRVRRAVVYVSILPPCTVPSPWWQ